MQTEAEKDHSQTAVFSVCMGWDAFRLCVGLKPRRFTALEVIAWISMLAKD